jgi:hypothetical protein
MCLIDNLMFPGMGIDLRRKSVTANGCSHCDFRFHQKGRSKILQNLHRQAKSSVTGSINPFIAKTLPISQHLSVLLIP